MSTLAVATIRNLSGTASTSSDNVINGSAKAWVSFNNAGGASGAIFASYNISSVTSNGSSIYTINFTNAFVDNNYCFVGGVVTDANTVLEGVQGYSGGTRSTTAFQVQIRYEGGSSGGTAGGSPTYCAFFR